MVSATRGINISALKSTLNKIIEDQFVEERITLDLSDSKKASQIHSLAEVLKIDYDEDGIKIHYKTSKQNSDRIKKIIHN
jgi:50S ribosomal subunit-associated GTPase HflX